jgi:hypothetical protein
MEQIWIATIEVQVEAGDMPSGDTLGFMKIAMWAETQDNFVRKVEAYLAKYDWMLLSIENTVIATCDANYDDETNHMIEEVSLDKNAVRLGTYYSYKPE